MLLTLGVSLRWVDHTNHASLAMSWESTVEPDWVGIVDGDGEGLWL
jgi:hypothetical protein